MIVGSGTLSSLQPSIRTVGGIAAEAFWGSIVDKDGQGVAGLHSTGLQSLVHVEGLLMKAHLDIRTRECQLCPQVGDGGRWRNLYLPRLLPDLLDEDLHSCHGCWQQGEGRRGEA